MDRPGLAVVVGGTSGIGLAIAGRLMEDGSDVIITGRNAERGLEAARALCEGHSGLEARFQTLDVRDPDQDADLIASLAGRAIDALVLSAAFGRQSWISETPPAVFLDMLQVNVAAPLRLVQALQPHMTSPSSVVLISSDAGVDGEQTLGAYSVTKAAVNMLGRMLALDLAPRNIRVNVVCPGDTVPGMRYLLRPGESQRAETDYLTWPIPPRGRLGRARDTAELVAFLVSPRADFMTGTVTLVDGGSRAGRPDPASHD